MLAGFVRVYDKDLIKVILDLNKFKSSKYIEPCTQSYSLKKKFFIIYSNRLNIGSNIGSFYTISRN